MTIIDPVSTARTTAYETTEPPAAAVENPGAILDRDAFLKLLVAQLKYQDPTKPADASEMLAQSAQLTMVDRLNDISTQLATSAASQRMSLASSVVGREITFRGADGLPITALVKSVRLDGDELVLNTGDHQVAMLDVTAIAAPAPTTTTTPTTTTDTNTPAAGAA